MAKLERGKYRPDQHGDRLAVFGIDAALEILADNKEVGDKKTPVDLVTKASLILKN